MSSTYFIPLPQAIGMTTLFRAEKENILTPAFRGQNILPVCETFERDAFDALLAQPGCVGIRVYFSMDITLKVVVVIVGVNGNREDMLPSTTTSDEKIVEEGQRCPDYCPPPSPLNS